VGESILLPHRVVCLLSYHPNASHADWIADSSTVVVYTNTGLPRGVFPTVMVYIWWMNEAREAISKVHGDPSIQQYGWCLSAEAYSEIPRKRRGAQPLQEKGPFC
jgi:hypothetical protein